MLGLRDYVIKSKFEKVVLGLSGGVDSALVAVIAKDALGSENVLCVALPSKFNSSSSLADAQSLAIFSLQPLKLKASLGSRRSSSSDVGLHMFRLK